MPQFVMQPRSSDLMPVQAAEPTALDEFQSVKGAKRAVWRQKLQSGYFPNQANLFDALTSSK